MLISKWIRQKINITKGWTSKIGLTLNFSLLSHAWELNTRTWWMLFTKFHKRKCIKIIQVWKLIYSLCLYICVCIYKLSYSFLNKYFCWTMDSAIPLGCQRTWKNFLNWGCIYIQLIIFWRIKCIQRKPMTIFS